MKMNNSQDNFMPNKSSETLFASTWFRLDIISKKCYSTTLNEYHRKWLPSKQKKRWINGDFIDSSNFEIVFNESDEHTHLFASIIAQTDSSSSSSWLSLLASSSPLPTLIWIRYLHNHFFLLQFSLISFCFVFLFNHHPLATLFPMPLLLNLFFCLLALTDLILVLFFLLLLLSFFFQKI